MNIAVIGDGGWGTTLAILLSGSKNDVRLWGAFPDYTEILERKRENIKFLPGVKIPDKIAILSDLNKTINGAELIVLAVPSQYMRKVLEQIRACGSIKQETISAAKGIENNTLLRMSEVIKEVLGDVKVGAISGPSIAYEVARSKPTTIVIASEDAGFSRKMQGLFMGGSLRVYTSPDMIGVELGGSLKNVIAIASGIADGLGMGANSKAAILTRGMQELTRLGLAMGAKRETFSGLSCMGDLITTCMSSHSRNRWFGEEIGKGKRAADIIKSTEMAVEGYGTAKSAYELSKKFKVEMPITGQMYEILYKKKGPKDAVKSLMARTPKDEIY